jgi:hypothetical protein
MCWRSGSEGIWQFWVQSDDCGGGRASKRWWNGYGGLGSVKGKGTMMLTGVGEE